MHVCLPESLSMSQIYFQGPMEALQRTPGTAVNTAETQALARICTKDVWFNNLGLTLHKIFRFLN